MKEIKQDIHSITTTTTIGSNEDHPLLLGLKTYLLDFKSLREEVNDLKKSNNHLNEKVGRLEKTIEEQKEEIKQLQDQIIIKEDEEVDIIGK